MEPSKKEKIQIYGLKIFDELETWTMSYEDHAVSPSRLTIFMSSTVIITYATFLVLQWYEKNPISRIRDRVYLSVIIVRFHKVLLNSKKISRWCGNNVVKGKVCVWRGRENVKRKNAKWKQRKENSENSF